VGGSFSYSPPLGSALTAGSQILTASFTPTDTTDYSNASATVTLTVNKATPIITWNTPAAVTVGTALSATQLDATANVPGTFVYNPAAGTTMSTAGSISLSSFFTPTDTTDYSSAPATVLLAVNSAAKITPMVTLLPTSSTITTAQQLGVTVTVTTTPGNPAPTGTVTLVGGNFSGNGTLSNGSTTITIPSGSLSVGTAQLTATYAGDSSYNTQTATGSVTVSAPAKTSPTITWSTPAAIPYGTALSATQLNATASVAGSFTYSPSLGAVLTAGPQLLTANFTPTDSTDYNNASASVTLTVNKATSTVTWNTPAAVTVGTALSAAQLSATANVPGTFVYSPSPGTVMSTAGNTTLSATFTPTDTADYSSASATVVLMVNSPAKTTPTVTATPSASSITTAQPLSVSVGVIGGSGGLTPTGSVVLSGGGYTSSALALNNGSATINIPAGALAVGTDALIANYAPDNASAATYNGATGSTAVTVTLPAKSASTVTVTPASSSITNQETDAVSIAVGGASGQQSPTGTVTLTSGTYSAQQTLASATATFTVPAGALSSGANTLTATYSGDGTFAGSSGTAGVTVSQVVVSASAPAAVSPGGSTTSNVTLSAGSTYSGTLNMSCALVNSPVGAQSLPTCTLSPASVTMTTGANGTTALIVQTTAASSVALVTPSRMKLLGLGSGGTILAGLLLLGVPVRRRRWMAMIVLLWVVMAASAIGCSGGGGSKYGLGGSSIPATTAGTYTFKITGTDSSNQAVTVATSVSMTVQ
jgi:hypothetical protein